MKNRLPFTHTNQDRLVTADPIIVLLFHLKVAVDSTDIELIVSLLVAA